MFERGRRKEKVLGELKPKIRKLIVDGKIFILSSCEQCLKGKEKRKKSWETIVILI